MTEGGGAGTEGQVGDRRPGGRSRTRRRDAASVVGGAVWRWLLSGLVGGAVGGTFVFPIFGTVLGAVIGLVVALLPAGIAAAVLAVALHRRPHEAGFRRTVHALTAWLVAVSVLGAVPAAGLVLSGQVRGQGWIAVVVGVGGLLLSDHALVAKGPPEPGSTGGLSALPAVGLLALGALLAGVVLQATVTGERPRRTRAVEARLEEVAEVAGVAPVTFRTSSPSEGRDCTGGGPFVLATATPDGRLLAGEVDEVVAHLEADGFRVLTGADDVEGRVRRWVYAQRGDVGVEVDSSGGTVGIAVTSGCATTELREGRVDRVLAFSSGGLATDAVVDVQPARAVEGGTPPCAAGAGSGPVDRLLVTMANAGAVAAAVADVQVTTADGTEREVLCAAPLTGPDGPPSPSFVVEVDADGEPAHWVVTPGAQARVVDRTGWEPIAVVAVEVTDPGALAACPDATAVGLRVVWDAPPPAAGATVAPDAVAVRTFTADGVAPAAVVDEVAEDPEVLLCLDAAVVPGDARSVRFDPGAFTSADGTPSAASVVEVRH